MWVVRIRQGTSEEKSCAVTSSARRFRGDRLTVNYYYPFGQWARKGREGEAKRRPERGGLRRLRAGRTTQDTARSDQGDEEFRRTTAKVGKATGTRIRRKSSIGSSKGRTEVSRGRAKAEKKELQKEAAMENKKKKYKEEPVNVEEQPNHETRLDEAKRDVN